MYYHFRFSPADSPSTECPPGFTTVEGNLNQHSNGATKSSSHFRAFNLTITQLQRESHLIVDAVGLSETHTYTHFLSEVSYCCIGTKMHLAVRRRLPVRRLALIYGTKSPFLDNVNGDSNLALKGEASAWTQSEGTAG